MLTLKKGHELNWFDLKYIESPLMAKRTVQSNHGAHFGGEIIHNGNEHGLPDNRSKVFEPYGAINNKLDNGQVFLINHSTQMPVIAKLEITANNTAKWKLNQGQNLMFLNALDGALNRVQVPKPYGVLRDEPAAPAENQTSAEKTVREKHIFLLDLEGQNERPLPPKHNITLVVENTTQSSLPVRQLKEVIYDSFSRVFTAEQGDSFKVFAVSDNMLDVRKDLNENKTLAASEANGLIAALQETGVETRADGVILHHVKYPVPNNFIEIELLDEDDVPEAEAKYQILNEAGKIISHGNLDQNGYAIVEGIDISEAVVFFPGVEDGAIYDKAQGDQA
jgi:hypothetical protein